MDKLIVKEVSSSKDLKRFIQFQDDLYKGNKYRVPQLHVYEKSSLIKDKNPAFDFCESKYWLAMRGQKVVGRIAGIINHESNKIWQEKKVRFGWIDFINEEKVAQLLIEAVENWAKSKGLNSIHGPMGFSDMDLEGMLVEGFDEISTQAVLYNYPYYPLTLENLGFVKDVDWVQHEINVPKEVPERVKRISNMVLQKYNLRVLKTNKSKDILPYAQSMFETYNQAFAHLYGFVPLTQKQIKHYIKEYFSIIDVKYVCFVLNEENTVVGFGISILSLSKALQKAKGKLFPTGFIHILKALKKNEKVDMLLQGVLPEYIKKGVASVFYSEMMQAYIDNGVTTAITSHILEINKNSHQMFDAYETRQHLRRRAYVKDIAS